MYNWRLLLFAFFAVFQPIASFTERNLVDGREQCCDHRLSGTLNGNYPFKELTENRHLNYPRDTSGIRRDDLRNERTVLIYSPTDAFRDARKRELNRGSQYFRSRDSRTTFQRMNNRVTSEIKTTHVCDTEINRDERNIVRNRLSQNSRFTTERRDRRTGDNVNIHATREGNQREALRQIPKDIVYVSRDIHTELRRTHDDRDRHYYQERTNGKDMDRRESITQNNLRNHRFISQRSVQSLNRFDRDAAEYRRTSDSYRVKETERSNRSDLRDFRSDAARKEARVTERADDDRKLTSSSLERLLSGRVRFYRTIIVIRDSRVNRQIRNYLGNDRRMEGRDMRESIKRLAPVRLAEFARVNVNLERNDMSSSPAGRSRTTSQIRHTTLEGHKNRVVRSFITDDIRREMASTTRRLWTIKSENRLNENKRERTNFIIRDRETQESRRNSRNNLMPTNILNVRALTRETLYERRSMRSEQQNTRAFDEIRQHNRRERRDYNDRVQPLEREPLTHSAQTKIVKMRTGYQIVESGVHNERLYRDRATSEESRSSSSKLDTRVMITRNSRLSENIKNDFRAMDLERRLVDNRVKSPKELTQNQINKTDHNESNGSNWQYLVYTMHGIYLCTIFLPILTDKKYAKKKTMSMKWGTSLQKLIKVD